MRKFVCHLQTKFVVEKCEEKIDLAFVVDGSASICGKSVTTCKNWDNNVKFVIDVASRFLIGPDATQVALVTFSTTARQIFNFNRRVDALTVFINV